MPGELGKCPTCGQSVSTQADACPHCGENRFIIKETDEKNAVVVTCIYCKGKGAIENPESLLPFGMKECPSCEGIGRQLQVEMITTDLRTGKKTQEGRYQYCRISPSVSTGCAGLILIFLTPVMIFLFAVLLR